MDKNTNMPTVFKIKKRYVVKNFLVLFLNEIKEKKKKPLWRYSSWLMKDRKTETET